MAMKVQEVICNRSPVYKENGECLDQGGMSPRRRRIIINILLFSLLINCIILCVILYNLYLIPDIVSLWTPGKHNHSSLTFEQKMARLNLTWVDLDLNTSHPGALLINTSTCQIPDWPVFDIETLFLFEDYHSRSINSCNQVPPFAIRRHNYTWIKVDYPPENTWACMAKEVLRNERDRFKYGATVGLLESLTNFVDNGTYVNGTGRWDAVEIDCLNMRSKVLHSRVVPLIQKRTAPKSPTTKSSEPTNSKSPPISILILGIDSVSRLQFFRHFTQTNRFLASHGFVTFGGHHKVGLNSFPNVLPILSGYPKEHYLRDDSPNATFTWDHAELLFSEAKARGYLTTCIEDMPFYGFFSYDQGGFKEQPTDYYLRPVNFAISKATYDTATVDGCYQEKLEIEHYYEYMLEQMDAFRWRDGGQPFFTFNHESQVTHDHGNFASAMDRPYATFLERLFAAGHAADTLLVLFSDHAIRYGDYTRTNASLYEDRLPFMALYVPEALRLNGRNAGELRAILRKNSGRLTSHFDLHTTMRHVLSGELPVRKAGQFGRSLFEEIPENRNCDDAGIPPQYCLCYAYTPVRVDSRVTANAKLIVEMINEKLASQGGNLCVPLALNGTTAAYVATSANGSLDLTLIRLYTSPNGGAYEVMLSREKNTNETTSREGGHPQIGMINRLNQYEGQSDCVGKNRQLVAICYCRDVYVKKLTQLANKRRQQGKASTRKKKELMKSLDKTRVPKKKTKRAASRKGTARKSPPRSTV